MPWQFMREEGKVSGDFETFDTLLKFLVLKLPALSTAASLTCCIRTIAPVLSRKQAEKLTQVGELQKPEVLLEGAPETRGGDCFA